MLNIQIQLIEPFSNQRLQIIKFNDMQTQKSLVIAKPCHENWGKMTPTEQGRFCNSCTKEVVDFRDKKKEDIIEYLESYKGEGQTCGQFSPNQIDHIGKTYINSSIYKRIGISFLALLGVFSFKNANAQKPKMGKVAIKGDVSYNEYNQANQKVEVTIFGAVRTLNGEKIAGAEIKFNHEGKQLASTKTIANGTFAIQLKLDKSMKAITMYTKANGYEMKINVIPNPAKEKIRVDIIMETEMMVLGEIAIQVDTVKTDSVKTCTNIIEKDSIIPEFNSSGVGLENPHKILVPDPSQKDSTQINPEIDLINDKKWLSVYPNPTSDNATIEWKNEGENTIEIFDLNGKMIWSTQQNGTKTVLNTSNLSNGNYLVKVTSKITRKTETAQLTVVH
jgi:hypothetical protein